MQQVYDVAKSCVDPVFILFVFLIISFCICLAGAKKKSGVLFLLLTIILLYGFSIQSVSLYLSSKLEKEYIRPVVVEEKKPLDAIVVLSGGTYHINALGKVFPGTSTSARLVHAVQMYRAYSARYLVCSGKGRNQISDAELMAQMAHDLGVPRESIRIEAKSTNTYEHAVEFNKLFADKNIRIGVVTSAFHMPRSKAEFGKYFKNVIPLPSDYLFSSPDGTPAVRYVPQSQWLLINSLIFKEYVGRLWYSVKDI